MKRRKPTTSEMLILGGAGPAGGFDGPLALPREEGFPSRLGFKPSSWLGGEGSPSAPAFQHFVLGRFLWAPPSSRGPLTEGPLAFLTLLSLLLRIRLPWASASPLPPAGSSAAGTVAGPALGELAPGSGTSLAVCGSAVGPCAAARTH